MPLNLDAGARLPTSHALENPPTTLDLPESALFRSLSRDTSSRLAPVLPAMFLKQVREVLNSPSGRQRPSQGCPVNGPWTRGPTPSQPTLCEAQRSGSLRVWRAWSMSCPVCTRGAVTTPGWGPAESGSNIASLPFDTSATFHAGPRDTWRSYTVHWGRRGTSENSWGVDGESPSRGLLSEIRMTRVKPCGNLGGGSRH